MVRTSSADLGRLVRAPVVFRSNDDDGGFLPSGGPRLRVRQAGNKRSPPGPVERSQTPGELENSPGRARSPSHPQPRGRDVPGLAARRFAMERVRAVAPSRRRASAPSCRVKKSGVERRTLLICYGHFRGALCQLAVFETRRTARDGNNKTSSGHEETES